MEGKMDIGKIMKQQKSKIETNKSKSNTTNTNNGSSKNVLLNRYFIEDFVEGANSKAAGVAIESEMSPLDPRQTQLIN
jgi:methionyl-tRNA formyltransferase